MNKTLKSYNTNNHGGGIIEVSFMRAFMRDAKLRDLVKSLAHDQTGGLDISLQQAAQLMLQTDSDNRGTVASMARELDEAAERGKISLMFNPVSCVPLKDGSLFISSWDTLIPRPRICRGARCSSAKFIIDFIQRAAPRCTSICTKCKDWTPEPSGGQFSTQQGIVSQIHCVGRPSYRPIHFKVQGPGLDHPSSLF